MGGSLRFDGDGRRARPGPNVKGGSAAGPRAPWRRGGVGGEVKLGGARGTFLSFSLQRRRMETLEAVNQDWLAALSLLGGGRSMSCDQRMFVTLAVF